MTYLPGRAVSKHTAKRRRGAELEAALRDAAWDELASGGYGAFTIEGVAARANTSRPVVYRRWSDRAELATAAIAHHGRANPVEVPDTGSLRGDLIDRLTVGSKRRLEMAVAIILHIADY